MFCHDRTGNGINQAASAGKLLSWTSTSVSVTTVGDTHNWYSGDIDAGNEYKIQIQARECKNKSLISCFAMFILKLIKIQHGTRDMSLYYI